MGGGGSYTHSPLYHGMYMIARPRVSTMGSLAYTVLPRTYDGVHSEISDFVKNADIS